MAPTGDMRRRRPCPALRGLVDSYEGYRFDGVAPALHHGLPSRYVTVVLSLGKPLDLVASPDPGQPADRYVGLIGGLHDRPARIRMEGLEYGIQLYVTPRGARELFGVRSADMGPGVQHLDAVLGRRFGSLTDQLVTADGFAEQFDTLDEALTRLLPDRSSPIRPEVVWAWDRMVSSAGRASVASLAGEVGWSRRHLADQFRAEYGLPPKITARVLRFERTVRTLRRDPRTPLAEVAVAGGYSDQAHFTREFRELAGRTPRRWLIEELPFVQDAAPLPDAD